MAATGDKEEVVPTSEYKAQQQQIRELQRLLGKKTLEAEILREALEVVDHIKNRDCDCCRCHGKVLNECRGRSAGCLPVDPLRTVRDTAKKPVGRPPQSDDELLGVIQEIIAAQPPMAIDRCTQ